MKFKSIFKRANDKNKAFVIIREDPENSGFAIDENGEQLDKDSLLELALHNNILVQDIDGETVNYSLVTNFGTDISNDTIYSYVIFNDGDDSLCSKEYIPAN